MLPTTQNFTEFKLYEQVYILFLFFSLFFSKDILCHNQLICFCSSSSDDGDGDGCDGGSESDSKDNCSMTLMIIVFMNFKILIGMAVNIVFTVNLKQHINRGILMQRQWCCSTGIKCMKAFHLVLQASARGEEKIIAPVET